MRVLLPLLIIFLVTSCSTLPRTSAELRKGTSAMSLSKTEIHILKRKHSLVVRDIKKKSMKCLNFSYSQSSTYGNVHMSHGTKLYNPKVVSTGPGKAEMTMQWDRLPRADHDPKGGYYMFLADIEKIDNTKTRLTMYGSSFSTWNPIFNAIKGWGQGKNIKCPDSP